MTNEPPAAAAPRIRAWQVALLVIVLLVVVAIAAGGNLGTLYTATPQTPKPMSFPPAEQSQAQPSMSGFPSPSATGQRGHVPGWLADLLKLAALTAVVVAVIIFARLLLANLRDKGVRKATAVRSEGIELPELAEEQVSESFAETLHRLRSGGNVDEAILSCWRRLVEIADDSGVRRRPSQTSEEFTVAILSHTRANRADLLDLAELYRQAMFSGHTIGEDDRDRAVLCLERLHESIKPLPAAAETSSPSTEAASAEQGTQS